MNIDVSELFQLIGELTAENRVLKRTNAELIDALQKVVGPLPGVEENE